MTFEVAIFGDFLDIAELKLSHVSTVGYRWPNVTLLSCTSCRYTGQADKLERKDKSKQLLVTAFLNQI